MKDFKNDFPFYRFATIARHDREQRTVDDFVDAIRTDTPAKRAARSAQTDEDRRAAKASAPAWFCGGAIVGDRIASDAVYPTGLVCVDVDHVDRPERIIEIKRRLETLSCCVVASASISARGVFGIMHVNPDIQADKSAVVGVFRLVELLTLYDREGVECIDYACADLARRRFEPYDPAPAYHPERLDRSCRYELNFLCACDRAFERSTLAYTASAFGCRSLVPAPGSAAVGCALALYNVAAGGCVAGRVLTREYYKARAQIAILGDSGAGKTTLKEALRTAAGMIGATTGIVESARALEVMLVKSALRQVETGDGTRYEQMLPPAPILATYDEAGDEEKARRRVDYKAGIGAIRRRTFDRSFGAAASISQKDTIPQVDFFCSYTDVQFSTPKSWALAKLGEDRTAGDARRVLEFWTEPEPIAQLEGVPESVRRLASRCTQAKPAADVETLFTMADERRQSLGTPDATDALSVRLDGAGAYALEMLQGAAALSDAGESESAIDDAATVICNLATITAWAEGHTRIERDDVLAAWSIYAAVLANRRKLDELGAEQGETQASRVTAAVLRYFDRGAKCLKYARAAFAKLGREYIAEFERLCETGVLVRETVSKTIKIRRATEAELEARAELDDAAHQAMTPTTSSTVTKPAPTPAASGRSYSECTRDEKIDRLKKYRASFETKPGHMIVVGNADNALFTLASDLARAGMIDETAIEYMRGVCTEIGHTDEKSQNRVMREMLK